MFELILAVGFVGGFFYLNSRVTHLEDTLRSFSQKTLPVPPQAPGPLADLVDPVVYQAAIAEVGVPAGVLPIAPPAPPAAPFDEMSGGKWLGRLGIAAIFIGVAFFLKYAFDTNLISVMGRIVLGVLTGAIFIGSGQYLRTKYGQYAHLLVGGGVAILYLSFYAAFALYSLMSQPVAFALMMLVTVITIVLSIVDDLEPIAVLAVLGGFATPYLISTGHNEPVQLFTYITIINIAVLTLSLRKQWLSLTYLSFVGTGIQYLAWYGMFYTPDQLGVAFSFLSLFFLMFLCLPTLQVFLGKSSTNEGDLMLTSVNALCYFSISYVILAPLHYSALWLLALLLGGLYYSASYSLYSANPKDVRLAQLYAGIATMCLTVAIPLKLEHSWITLGWFIEAALLWGIAFEYKYKSISVFASGVYALALCKLFFDYQTSDTTHTTPFLNEYVGLFLVAIGLAYFVSYMYHTHAPLEDESQTLSSVFFVIANIFSIYILTSQISVVYALQEGSDLTNQKNTVISIVWSVYSILLLLAGFGAKLRIARLLGLVFFFLTACEIFLTVWSLGELYRIIASILFGAIALLGSFIYVKYSARIKEIVL